MMELQGRNEGGTVKLIKWEKWPKCVDDSITSHLFFKLPIFLREEPISKDRYANKMQKQDRFKKYFFKD